MSLAIKPILHVDQLDPSQSSRGMRTKAQFGTHKGGRITHVARGWGYWMLPMNEKELHALNALLRISDSPTCMKLLEDPRGCF